MRVSVAHHVRACVAQVKGDVKITSQYGQPAIGGGATGNVALWSQGSDLTVRGDLAVQSADAGAGANSGFAELATAQSGAEMPPSSGLSVSNIVVGGKNNRSRTHDHVATKLINSPVNVARSLSRSQEP
jgi:hypothetical protein